MGIHITVPDKLDFDCPICTCHHDVKDWEDKMWNSKKGIIKIKCKGCKRWIGLTQNHLGDVCVWEHNKEK